MDDKKKKNSFDNLTLNASTLQECTGLVAEGYGTEEELEKYNEIYNFIQVPIVKEDDK